MFRSFQSAPDMHKPEPFPEMSQRWCETGGPHKELPARPDIPAGSLRHHCHILYRRGVENLRGDSDTPTGIITDLKELVSGNALCSFWGHWVGLGCSEGLCTLNLKR